MRQCFSFFLCQIFLLLSSVAFSQQPPPPTPQQPPPPTPQLPPLPPPASPQPIPSRKSFSVDDGRSHYAFKTYYAFSPIIAFKSATVGSTQGDAKVALANTVGFKVEYGFYNRKFWNLLAGAGFDFERGTTTEQITLSNGSFSNSNGPHLKLSSLVLYLSINYPFQNFYLNGSMLFVTPNISFDNSRSFSGKGGIGYEIELGYMITHRWSVWGSYREHQISATARSLTGNDFSFDNGTLTDFLLGVRYIFR